MTQSPRSLQQLAAQCECELSHRDGNAERLKSFLPRLLLLIQAERSGALAIDL